MSTEDELDKLYDATLQALIDKVTGGEASAADLQAARQFLRDQGHSANPNNPPPGLGRLRSVVEDQEDELPLKLQ